MTYKIFIATTKALTTPHIIIKIKEISLLTISVVDEVVVSNTDKGLVNCTTSVLKVVMEILEIEESGSESPRAEERVVVRIVPEGDLSLGLVTSPKMLNKGKTLVLGELKDACGTTSCTLLPAGSKAGLLVARVVNGRTCEECVRIIHT